MIHVTIKLDTKEVRKLVGRVKKLPDNLANTVHKFAETLANSYRFQFLAQQKLAPRGRLAARIHAQRLSRFRSVIKMPLGAYHLDTMKPHYVPLKRGRLITQWARKYYSKANAVRYGKTGKSRVWRGPRKGIRGGYLYVTPDPFIETAERRVRHLLSKMLATELRKTLAGG
jgi:hypothetical protein